MEKEIPILLVEDDDIDVETVKRAFEKSHITNPLYVTGNGQEALDFLRHEGKYSDPASSPRPGIILLDLNMPVMNGIEFLKVRKDDEELAQIPVFVLSTSRQEGDIVASYKHHVAGYIVKPVAFEKFVEAIKGINAFWTLTLLPKK